MGVLGFLALAVRVLGLLSLSAMVVAFLTLVDLSL
jgi:hypothetical protein